MQSRIFRLTACSFTMLFLLCVAVAQNEPRHKELPNFHRVNDQLYRGAQPRLDGLERLSKLGIRTIINLRDDDQQALIEEQRARAAGFHYFNVPVAKFGRPDAAHIEKVLAIINSPEKQPVFVHCKHGADRTGVIVGAYRILYEGWTSERAKAEAKRFGMKIWQIAMKDYLHDLYRDRKVATSR